MTHGFVYNILLLGVPFSVALLLASLGEMFNQRAGVFNLGCEGIMCMGAFLGFLPPYFLKDGPLRALRASSSGSASPWWPASSWACSSPW